MMRSPRAAPQSLMRYCESQQSWAIATTEALVRLESPTFDKASVDRCGDDLADRLAAIGGQVERVPQADVGHQIRAAFGGGPPRVLLLGHFDTVWPVGQLARMPIRHASGRLHGPGVLDMKAGIAIGMLAIRAVLESCPTLAGSIVMLLTTDEETGSHASVDLIMGEARRVEAVLVLEPALPDGGVKTSRKGCGQFELTVRGVPAHAGIEPERGASAVHELAAQVVRILELADPPRGVTVNVGTCRGGTRANVVADRAEALIDVRAQTMVDAARLEAALLGLRPMTPGTVLDVAGHFRPPLERNAGVAGLYTLARSVAAELGRDLGEGGTGGGSDGNYTAAAGIATLDGLGAVGRGAHALDEHIELSEIPWRAALLAGLIARLATAR